MSIHHKDTIIYGNGWFDEKVKLDNIVEPCFIIVDNVNLISRVLPNIFIQVEPDIICNNTDFLIKNHMRYHTIFTFNQRILDTCPNAKRYIYGTTWIPSEIYNNIDILKKEFRISTLTSSKLINNAPGHTFRHIIHSNQGFLSFGYPITFFRSLRHLPYITDFGNNPFLSSDSKNELFERFQFSIIIENSRQQNYFTEKIMDCLLTKTIPIYWGCPNIKDFFDITGWIILDTDNISDMFDKMSPLNKDYYNVHLQVIEENYLKAKEYANFYKNLNNAK